MHARTLARGFALLGAALLLPLLGAAPATATLLPTQTVDGPSGDLIGLDGVAMAPDGTGGLVYRRRDDGHVHVFAARVVNGRWFPPQRVDVGANQGFDSSWPAIGAGRGGRLVVTWVQEFGAETDRMFSASLDPGASRFQAPLPVDLNVGEATATFPSLAMNPSGQAYLVYRVLTNPLGTGLPPGYVGADTRIARYDGGFWSVLSPQAKRNLSSPVRKPTAANSPKVAIDVTGNGLVAFQEPDDDFIDRVWARRIFSGGTVTIPLLVSLQKYGGKPLRAPADQLAVSSGGFGDGAVAFRQQPDATAGLKGARVFVNTIPTSFDDAAHDFTGAKLVDGGAPSGAGGTPDSISVSTAADTNGGFLVGYGIGSAAFATSGSDDGVDPPGRLDTGANSAPSAPVVDTTAGASSSDVQGAGAGSVAWAEDGDVQVQERSAGGVTSSDPISAPAGGVIHDLRLAGSTLGDAAIAFRQGEGAGGQIVAAVLDAPPQDFTVDTPIDWVRKRKVPISWDPAANANGGVRYTVTVDDQEAATGLRGLARALGPDDLPDGRHTVKVTATDSRGQQGSSQGSTVKVDRRAPLARVSARGRRVTVVVADRASGFARDDALRAAIRVSFGGRRGTVVGRKRAVHRYARRGRYVVRVTARDNAGNVLRLRRTVRVR